MGLETTIFHGLVKSRRTQIVTATLGVIASLVTIMMIPSLLRGGNSEDQGEAEASVEVESPEQDDPTSVDDDVANGSSLTTDSTTSLATVTQTSSPTGCERVPVNPLALPSPVEVQYGDDQCPFYSGVVTGPGASHEYQIELRAGDDLSVFADGNCNARASVLGPGGAVLDGPDGVCPAATYLAAVTAAVDGLYLVQIRVNDNRESATYNLHLFTTR